MRRLLAPLLLLVAASCLGQETPAPQAASAIAGMEADFVVKNAAPSLHEPVWADLSITNNGTADVDVDLGANYIDAIRGTAVLPDGTSTELRSPYEGGFAALGKVHIRAHDSWARTYLLNDWLPFATPGRYELALQLPSLPAPVPVVIVVGARDEAKLKATYAELASAALEARNAQRRIDSARALARAGDPLAVPQLALLLTTNDPGVFSSGAEGLRRIGNAAAIDALATAIPKVDALRSSIAVSQLRLLRPRVTDAKTQRRIDTLIAAEDGRPH